MTLFILITLALILGKMYCMTYNKLPSDVIGIGIFAVLLLTGTLSIEEALSCFSAMTVVVVAVLSILVAALVHSGVLQWIEKYLLGQPRNYKNALIRLMAPVAFLSSFLSNNVVVYTFISVVRLWSKKLHIAPSRLL
ncbi:MAG: citrate transporter, partial [Bacteroidaceae bacterium]|nr:citrate transporter [Bacteroidaceae bacterium]